MAVSSLALSKVNPDWFQLFPDEFSEVATLIDALSDSAAKSGELLTPQAENILRVFETPPKQVKVLIVGQDPYPTLADATGLAFSVERDSRLPKSLQNIFKELASDLAKPLRSDGNLIDWQSQGVFLLNRTLTTTVGNSLSHKNLGWEEFTEKIIAYLANCNAVGLLMGKSAAELAPHFKKCVITAHPSPLSAYKGFFNSKPFSQMDQLLENPIRWS